MSEFKTRSEIGGDSEFIQYLERLKSGSLTSGEGVNRPLERLAENTDALLNVAMSAQSAFLRYDSTLTWTAGALTLSFTTGATATIVMLNPADGATTNVVATPVNVVLPNSSAVVYTVLSRATDGATVTLSTAASISAYLTLVQSAGTGKADYFLVAVGDGAGGLRLFNGQHLRDGESLVNNAATDTQYGQQSELTLVRNNQRDNLKLMLTRGGDVSWDAGTETLTFSDDLIIEFPSDAGNNRVLANSFTVSAGEALYVTLSRDPSGAVSLTPSTASIAGSVPDTDDTLVLAIHKTSDSRVYLWDGTALSDGETVRLGGVRTGVQFFYREAGLGAASQIYDLASLVGANTEYRVGSGELMVYRNGKKATPSKAYWQGTYPAGSLNVTAGVLTPFDDYVEEDADGVGGTLTGSRILWLREDPTPSGGSLTGNETSTSLYLASGTFPPGLAQTFPDNTDLVEMFIGNQGAAPYLTVPDGLYGFDLVWTSSAATVRTRGGTLVVGGAPYRNTAATPLEVTLNGTAAPPAIYSTDTLPEDDWAYIYLGPGSTIGGQPDIVISSSEPTQVGGWGTHPDDSNYKFLTSAYVLTGRAAFRAFSKRGDWVQLDRNSPENASVAFASAITGNFESVNLSLALPGSAQGAARVSLVAAVSGTVGDGDGVNLDVKQSGASWGGVVGGPVGALKPANSLAVQFTFETMGQPFDVRFASSDYASVLSAIILGYAEGRFTAGTGL